MGREEGKEWVTGWQKKVCRGLGTGKGIGEWGGGKKRRASMTFLPALNLNRKRHSRLTPFCHFPSLLIPPTPRGKGGGETTSIPSLTQLSVMQLPTPIVIFSQMATALWVQLNALILVQDITKAREEMNCNAVCLCSNNDEHFKQLVHGRLFILCARRWLSRMY